MRRTSPRRTRAAAALAAATAMLALGLQGGTTAAAAPDSGGEAAPLLKVAPRPGALPDATSPKQRSTLMSDARAAAGTTAEAIGLGSQEKLTVRDVVKDADGTTHTRYERTYAGLPVLGGDLVVHQDSANRITDVTRNTDRDIAVADLTPDTTAAKAQATALAAAKAAGARQAATDTSPRKVIWATGGTPVLAWESVIGGLQDDGTPNELHVITDARSGKTIYQYQAVHNGVGNSEYSGQVEIGTDGSAGSYSMTDTTRGGHRTYSLAGGYSGTGVLLSDDDDVWGDGTAQNTQTAAVDAHYGAAETWDFYQEAFGRDGIRGDGVGAYSRVHYGNGYVNAYWQDSCFCMTYGDGQGNAAPLTALDVAAHEMTHGVTAATAGLVYSGESGGLNEGTSDIMAAAVEFHADNPEDPGDYLVGEKIDINGDGTPLRYMDQPSKDGRSKDYWYPGVGSADVHYTSGIANHFFYLLSEGSGQKEVNGVSYDSPTYDGVPVTGIGIEAAQQIWYKALTEQFTSGTDYAAARTGTLQAAADLYGTDSAAYYAVANAWAAVNVGEHLYAGVNLKTPLDQYSARQVPTSLQIEAFSTNPGPLTYRAKHLPSGLEIDRQTGLISGQPKRLGTSTITITVKDKEHKSSRIDFRWEIGPDAGQAVYENGTDVAIPDYGAPVESGIPVRRAGTGGPSLTVDVDIVHTFRGDLSVDLVAPDGTSWRLHDVGYDPAPDIKETYTIDASQVTANGTWTLRVQDQGRLDTGYINAWGLSF